MEEETREVIADRAEPKDINPFDYVTIPVKEYRQLIEDLERAKAQVEIEKQDAMFARAQMYDMRDMVKQYKNDLRKKCGLDVQAKVGDMNA